MARVVFDSDMDSVPRDLDGELTEWRLGAGQGYSVPITPNIDHRVGHTLDGAAYQASDADARFLGLSALTVRAEVRPDWIALVNETVCIAARGQGGDTAGEYVAWACELVVNEDAQSGNIRLSFQRASNGADVVLDLGVVTRTPGDPWLQITWTRERSKFGFFYQGFVDGVRVGAALAADEPAATPTEPITIGARASGSSFDRHFLGDIAQVVLEDQATTEAREALAYRASFLLHGPLAARIRALLPPCEDLELVGSAYDSYRIQPLARLLVDLERAVIARDKYLLPPVAFDSALEVWERSLRLEPDPLTTIIERQQLARLATALVDGLGVEALTAYAAQVLGLSPAAVSIQICPGDMQHSLARTRTQPFNASTRTQLVQLRHAGNMSTIWSGTALELSEVDSTNHVYLSPAHETAGLAETYCPPGRFGLHAVIEFPESPAPNSDAWLGITARTGNAITWFSFEAGDGIMIQRIDSPGAGSYSFSLLGAGLIPPSPTRRYDFVLYQATAEWGGALKLRVKDFEGSAWLDVDVAFAERPTWIGFGEATATALDTPCMGAVHALRILDPRARSYLWTAVGNFTGDPLVAKRLLARRNRASSMASASVDAEFELGSPSSGLNVTPLLCPGS